MIGTPGDDELIGGTGNDTIRGGAGNDWIGDYGGDDRILGEAGDDRLSGGSGDDYISGGDGDDFIFVGDNRSVIDAGAGNDEVTLQGYILPTADITLGAGVDTFSLIEEYSDEAVDVVSVGIGTYVIRDFTHGEDVFGSVGIAGYRVEFSTMDSNKDDVIDGKDIGVDNVGGALVIDVQAALYAAVKAFYEADQPNQPSELAFDDPELEAGTSIVRLDGVDQLTADDFRMHSTAGDDEIYGTSGRDVIRLGDGNDLAYGNPMVQSEIGDDLIYGEQGNDEIHGAEGNDVLIGGSGNDRLFGDGGDDVLGGGAGNDVLFDYFGATVMMGGDGDDFLTVDDFPYDTEVGETMHGGNGNDRIQGGVLGDTIQGGPGDDVLSGNRGANNVSGGGGDDLISVGQDDIINAGIGNDVVRVNGGTSQNPQLGSYPHLSTVTLGSGEDRFEMAGTADDRYGRGIHVVTDFRLGEDLLGDLGFAEDRAIGFAALDGNGDGTIDIRDSGVRSSQGGLFIDLAAAAEHSYGEFDIGGASSVLLLGIQALRRSDFAEG